MCCFRFQPVRKTLKAGELKRCHKFFANFEMKLVRLNNIEIHIYSV